MRNRSETWECGYWVMAHFLLSKIAIYKIWSKITIFRHLGAAKTKYWRFSSTENIINIQYGSKYTFLGNSYKNQRKFGENTLRRLQCCRTWIAISDKNSILSKFLTKPIPRFSGGNGQIGLTPSISKIYHHVYCIIKTNKYARKFVVDR